MRPTSFGVAGADVFAIRYAPGRRGRRAAGARADRARARPSNRRRSTASPGAVDDALGRVFGLFDALAIVAVVVAALGIVNTLTMNVLERVREIGVLRAAGMTRGQVRRTVVVEAGILGLVGRDPRDRDRARRGGAHGPARRRAARLVARRCRGRRSVVAVVLGVGVVDARRLVSGPAREPARRSCAAVQHE